MASNVIPCGVLIIITIHIQNSRMPLIDGEKVKAFLLAPSTYHESRSMRDVANSILEGGILAGDTRFLRQAFFATDYTAHSPELSIPETVEANFDAFVDGNEKPLVLFEYKPAVHKRNDSLGQQDLMEVLIQGYYSVYQHDVSSIVHCLTDLEQFYYFKMEKAETRKMRISWNFSLSEQSLNAHLKFLYPILKEAFPA